MMRTALLFVFCSLLAASAPAAASVTVFEATLDGSQVNPPTPSGATGSATITVDDALQTLSVDFAFTGLTSPATASHIHCCAPVGTNATAAIPMAGFPSATSGVYLRSFDLTDPNSWNAAFITAHGGTTATAFSYLLNGMLSGNSYINIHDSAFPGGEISGQIRAVPEPSTWAMLLLGFCAIGASLRTTRRKQSVTEAQGDPLRPSHAQPYSTSH